MIGYFPHIFSCLDNSGICKYCQHQRSHNIHVSYEAGAKPLQAKVTVFDGGLSSNDDCQPLGMCKPSNPKDAIGVTKPPTSTVPSTVIAEVGVAMLEGSLKYGRHNYRVIGVRSSVYYDAAHRHLNKWWEGEDIDADSGLSHITKAIATLFVLRDAMIQDMLNDDRPPMAPPGFFKALEVETKNVLAKYPNPVPAHTQKGESEKEQK